MLDVICHTLCAQLNCFASVKCILKELPSSIGLLTGTPFSSLSVCDNNRKWLRNDTLVWL